MSRIPSLILVLILIIIIVGLAAQGEEGAPPFGGAAGPQLVAHYNFEDAEQPGADATGNGITAVLFANNGIKPVVRAGDGIGGHALYCDGSLGEMRHGSPFQAPPDARLFPSSISVALWLKLDELPNAIADISQHIAVGGSHVSFRLNNGNVPQIMAKLPAGNKFLNARSALEAGRWYHLAATYVSGRLAIYIDGALSNSLAEPGNLNMLNPDSFRVCSRTGGTRANLKGLFDDIRVYNSALSAESIATLHTEGRAALDVGGDGADAGGDGGQNVIQPGERCEKGVCADGFVCRRTNPAKASRFCAAPIPAGSADPCDRDSDCVQDLTCQNSRCQSQARVELQLNDRCDTVPGGICIGGLVCRKTAPASDGQVCVQPAAETNFCEKNADCSSPLTCQQNVCVGQVQQGGNNQPCRASEPRCNNNLVCTGGKCLPPQGGEGQPCRGADPKCDGALTCSANNVCVQPSPPSPPPPPPVEEGGEGQPCRGAADGLVGGCDGGLECSADDVCVRPPPPPPPVVQGEGTTNLFRRSGGTNYLVRS